MIKIIPGLKDSSGHDVIDFASLETLKEFQECIDGAGLVFLLNKKDKTENILLGKEMLVAIRDRVIPAQQMGIVVFAIDYATDELEKIIAAAHVTRGYHDYSGSDGKNPQLG